MHLTHLSSVLAPRSISPFNEAVIADQRGNIIAANDPNHLNMESVDLLASHPRFKNVADFGKPTQVGISKVGIVRVTDSAGAQWLVFDTKMEPGWHLFLLRRLDYLQTEIAPQVRSVTILAACILLLPSLLALYMALYFGRRWKIADTALREINVGLERCIYERTAELQKSETRHRTLFESTADAVLILNRQVFIDCNPAALRVFGANDRAEIVSGHLKDVSSSTQIGGEESCIAADRYMDQTLVCGSCAFEWIYRRVDTSASFFAEVLLSRMDFEGETLIQATVRDITEQKQAEARLQLAASVFTHAREGIMITDATGTIIEVNNTFSVITGYSREDAVGQNPRILQSGRHTQDFYAAMWQSLVEKSHWYGEVWNCRKNGEIFVEMLNISAVQDAASETKNYVALFTDITAMKEHQQQLEHIAHYDVLTGLPNRVLLADRLQQAMNQSERREQSLAVAYLDLDGFKAVNDTHGHKVGDELLIALSQRMNEALREGDTLARISGDEFVAVLVDMEKTIDYEPVLTRLLKGAADPVTVGNATLQVSASIGVTLYPQDGGDADQLMRHADQAMYVVKQAGKDRYHLFDVHQDAATKTQRESLDAIHSALDHQEFVLYYQPKVNMKNGEVIGSEALIRWQHPERGLVPPGDFLPIIENHPVSVELGEWVIDTALAQMTKWHTAGLDIPISVNVGARQLQEHGFVPRLSAALARYPDVKPGWLELEILETSALEDIAEVSSIMHACREIGVSFALDDFGTGYSSLTYLKRLPADLLKIDQSFVSGMLDDPDDRAIVTGVIGLAVAFKREVIAEGVETIAHGTQLLPMGCILAQGYGIARPMPAAEMPAWISNWRPDEAWKG
ncbi:MAG: EAL domain-containing protein [Gammaproteobacteria bacterium]|nr:EAL domain-containing protein [Gammaproteobacteria bacterium]